MCVKNKKILADNDMKNIHYNAKSIAFKPKQIFIKITFLRGNLMQNLAEFIYIKDVFFPGGFRIETQMEFCNKDVKAFTELSENGDEMKDFSKFSKIPLPVNIVEVITNLIKLFSEKTPLLETDQ